jgi:ABC-2 type transport system ATP-binding protein
MTTTNVLNVIEATSITKRFGTKKGAVQALAGLDLVAGAGQVTAVLGPNGAGKSTLVRAVATLVRPDSGRLTVAGIDAARHPEQVRRVIGLAGQHAAVEPALTGRENLVMVARLFGHRRAAAHAAAQSVLTQLGLEDSADRVVRGYSGGMRRRLDLGASLVGAPRLLLLDEPTTGLDPRSRMDLWEAIRSMVRGGTDVLLTTQYLEEADQLADRVTIVDRGRAIATGTPEELKSLAGRDVVEVRVRRSDDVGDVHRVLAALGVDPPRVDEPARRITVAVDDGSARLAEAVRVLAERHLDLDDIGLRRPTLDEVFLTLTGGPATQAA